MRAIGLLVLALLVVTACDAVPGSAPKGATGPTGDAAHAVSELLAPGTPVMDARFESFLADIDLAKVFGSRAAEIRDQITDARTAATKPKTATAASGGHLASVPAVLGEWLTIEFAKTLADSLDEFTKTSATREYPRGDPNPHTSEGATAATTSSTAITETLSSVGPQVKLSINWSYRETTKDKASGAVLVDLSEVRTMAGSINICPDQEGSVGAFIDVKDNFTGIANGSTTTLNVTSGTVFTGHVNDGASLQNVHETLQDAQSWESAGGNGHYDMTLSATFPADASGGTGGDADASSWQGAYTFSDAAAAVRSATAAAWSFVLDHHSLADAFQSAQRLWRNGRCVVVTAPDYSAETPIDTADQAKPQNDKAVDPSSETKFAIGLRHRFSGNVSAPTTATLSGQKTIEPSRVDGGSGSLTYKAPDEQDKKATVTLRSTSKRGIGTLVLDFHTGGALTLSITGEVRADSSRIGTVRTLDAVKIGPLEFKALGADLWQASGTWSAETSSFTAVGLGSDTCSGSESGTVTLMATTETRAGKKVWVIDPKQASSDGSGTTTCQSSLGDQTLRGATIPGKRTSDTDGGSAELFLGNLSPFTIPAEGGTVAVHGSRGNPLTGSFTADGTAVGKTK